MLPKIDIAWTPEANAPLPAPSWMFISDSDGLKVLVSDTASPVVLPMFPPVHVCTANVQLRRFR